jgi:hypothetical protein
MKNKSWQNFVLRCETQSDLHTLGRASSDRGRQTEEWTWRNQQVVLNAPEVSGSHSVLIALHSFIDSQMLILRSVQVQNVIDDVQIVQKQRTL